MGGRFIAYRMVWALPMPVLVGAVADRLAGLRPNRLRALVAVALVAVVLIPGGRPGVVYHVAWPPSWDLDPVRVDATRELIDLAPRGGIVASTRGINEYVGLFSTEVFAVDPRRGYTVVLEAVAGQRGHVDERFLITDALEGKAVDPVAFTDALDLLDVDAVAPNRRAVRRFEDALLDAGFTRRGASGEWTMWSRG
jgi:hypothetical protein